MKISKFRRGILFIFLFFILIQTITFATYETVVLGEVEKSNINEIKAEIESEEVILSNDEQKALDLINEYRKQNGLTELKAISSLQRVAKLKAEDLVNNNYFSHTSEALGTPFEMLKNNGVTYKAAGENLAGNTTSERAVTAWINSPAHRDNILDSDFEYTGLYVIESPVYGKVFVQLFMGI